MSDPYGDAYKWLKGFALDLPESCLPISMGSEEDLITYGHSHARKLYDFDFLGIPGWQCGGKMNAPGWVIMDEVTDVNWFAVHNMLDKVDPGTRAPVSPIARGRYATFPTYEGIPHE